MNIRYLERGLIVLLMLVVVAMGVVMLLFSFGAIAPGKLIDLALSVRSSALTSLINAFIGVLLILLVCGIVALMWLNHRIEKRLPLYSGELGTCIITGAALTDIIRKYLASYQAVRDCTADYAVKQDAVNIGVKLILPAEDTSFQGLADGSMNNSLREYLRNVVGINVNELVILVDTPKKGGIFHR